MPRDTTYVDGHWLSTDTLRRLAARAPKPYPFLVIDTRTETVAAVYAERADADSWAEPMNEAFPNRYVVYTR
jgi:hypothetical protein